MNNGLGNLLIEIGMAIKKYEENNSQNKVNDSKLLKSKEVLSLYPVLTLYGLNEAVKKGLIPVVKRGKLNYYDSLDVENYIKSLKYYEHSSIEEIKPKDDNSKYRFI